MGCPMGCPMVVPWLSHGCPMVVPWVAGGGGGADGGGRGERGCGSSGGGLVGGTNGGSYTTSMTPMDIDSGSGNKNAHPTSSQQGRGCTPVAPRLNVVSGGEPRPSAKMGVYFSRQNGTRRGPPATSLNTGARGGENSTSRWMGAIISRTGITEGR